MITIFNKPSWRSIGLTVMVTLLFGLLGTSASAQVSGQRVRSALSEQFHGSATVSFVRLAPSPPERATLERHLGARLPKGEYTVFVATTGARVDGYAVFDQERGQHELIDFAAFFDAEGKVTRVDVLAYREPYGDAIRGERFRRQFIGRSSTSGFRAEHDVDVVSGATISSRAMCAGVQRATLLVHLVLSHGGNAHGAR